jgi:uncharacterized protein with PIN domain
VIGKITIGHGIVGSNDRMMITKNDGGTFEIEIGLIADLLADDDSRDVISDMIKEMLRDKAMKSLGVVRCPECSAVVEDREKHSAWHFKQAVGPREMERIAVVLDKEWPAAEKSLSCSRCGCMVVEGHVCVGTLT